MRIIGGLDVHRSQITCDWIDPETGQHQRGRLAPAHRGHLRTWLEQFQDRPAAFALEGCAGWRYVVEELQRAGIAAHLAEPADTSTLRGPKHRAKTDRTDARPLRELLAAGRLPQSWIPPTHVLEARTQVRCYKALADGHTARLQRVHATLFHHGVPAQRNLLTSDQRARLERGTGRPGSWSRSRWDAGPAGPAAGRADRPRPPPGGLPGAGWPGRHRPADRGGDLGRAGGCGALHLIQVCGAPQRPGRHRVVLRRQAHPWAPGPPGPPVLRWALVEAAKCAARACSPDHADYLQVKGRLGGNRATLAVARKLVGRCSHTLGALGEQAYAPPSDAPALG